MREILNFQKFRNALPNLQLWDATSIKKLLIEREAHSLLSIYCDLQFDQYSPPLIVSLKFYGVSNLRIVNGGGCEFQVAGFDVRDISEKGWEDKLWETIDFEDDSLHWYSKSVEVVVVEKLS